jgi:hypothetical protein
LPVHVQAVEPSSLPLDDDGPPSFAAPVGNGDPVSVVVQATATVTAPKPAIHRPPRAAHVANAAE